ncbi:MAG: aminotransferase class III-fold pyridoxal phosphate-dependent enzyme [Thaumarchaeota archaeon]|nr:aminotransferase class III-fold pyridoxal phosphate-dependent enzyme [Nitrososphaerota archaeon]
MNNQQPKIQRPPTSGEAGDIIARDASLMSRSYRRAFPIVVKRVHGALVEDINDNSYIDFTSGLRTLPIGGNHPEVVKALRSQLEKVASYNLMAAYSEEPVELVEELSRIAPIRGDVRALFCSSGSEAIDAAIRSMRWHSGKNVILTFLGEYHGSTITCLTASTDERARRTSTRILDIIYSLRHDCEVCPIGSDPKECKAECLKLSRDLIKSVAPEDLSAILFEPIHFRMGLSFPPADYFEKLRVLAKELGGLTIANELITSPARTGRWFALDHWNAKVDAVCLGEQLASGLPLGILLAREELLDLKPGMHELTAGLQLSTVAALTTLRVIREEGLVERSERLGRRVLKRLRDHIEDLGLGWRIGGVGLLTGIGVLGEDGLGDERLAKLIVDECFRVGLLLERRGATLILSPALNIEEEILEKGLEIFEEKVAELSQLSQAS